jgi:hypothetical protein
MPARSHSSRWSADEPFAAVTLCHRCTPSVSSPARPRSGPTRSSELDVCASRRVAGLDHSGQTVFPEPPRRTGTFVRNLNAGSWLIPDHRTSAALLVPPDHAGGKLVARSPPRLEYLICRRRPNQTFRAARLMPVMLRLRHWCPMMESGISIRMLPRAHRREVSRAHRLKGKGAPAAEERCLVDLWL